MKPIGLDTALARAVAANFDVEQFDDRAVRLTIRGRYSTMDMRTDVVLRAVGQLPTMTLPVVLVGRERMPPAADFAVSTHPRPPVASVPPRYTGAAGGRANRSGRRRTNPRPLLAAGVRPIRRHGYVPPLLRRHRCVLLTSVDEVYIVVACLARNGWCVANDAYLFDVTGRFIVYVSHHNKLLISLRK